MNAFKRIVASLFAGPLSHWATAPDRIEHVLRDRLADRRLLIGLAIAFVATFLAAATFRAEWWDFIGTGCTRTLSEAQTYEVVRDQAVRTRRTAHANLRTEYDGRIGEGRRLLDRALRDRKSGSGAQTEPDVLTIGAQVQFATARTMVPVLEFSDPGGAVFGAEDQLSDRARADLRETILRKQCPHVTGTSRDLSPETFVDDLREDVRAIHQFARNDSWIAAVLVLVLGLLTWSDYRRGNDSISLAALAALVFAVTVVYACVAVDGTLFWVFADAAVVYVVILFVTIVAIVDRELRRSGQLLAPNAAWVAPGRTSIFVTLLVFATLLNAAAGAVYNGLKGNSNVDFADAQSLELSTLRRSAAFEDRAYLTIDGMRRLREANLGSRAVAGLLETSRGKSGRGASYVYDRDEVRWQSAIELLAPSKPSGNVLDTLAPTLKSVSEGDYGPYDDPLFPVRYYVDRTIKIPALLFAERDARNERSAEIEGRINFIVGSLAALAIAAYLATEGLRARNDGSRIRNSAAPFVLSMYSGTSFIAAVLLGLAAFGTIVSVPPVNDEVVMPVNCAASGENLRAQRDVAAALCFASGETAAKLHDNQTAALLYEEAAEIRPGFAIARYLAVLTSINDPSYGSLATTIAAERRVMNDLKALGRSTAKPIIENLGYHELLSGITTGDAGMLERSVGDTYTAAKLSFNEPSLGYRHALALLAHGWKLDPRAVSPDLTQTTPAPRNAAADASVAEAQLTYCKGGNVLTAHLAVSAPNAAPTTAPAASIGATQGCGDAEQSGSRQSTAAASALTDLELLREHCPTVTGRTDPAACDHEIDSVEAKVVTAVWGRSASRKTFTFDQKPQIVAMPGGIAWRVGALRPSPSKKDVVVLILSASGATSSKRTIAALSERLDPAPAGRRWTFRSLLAASRYTTCLQMQDTYSAKFYVNGRLIETARPYPALEMERPSPAERFRVATFHEPGVAMCYPQSWERGRVDFGALSGSYRDNNTGHGAMVHAFFDGRSPTQPNVPRERVEDGVQQTLRSLGGPSLRTAHLPASGPACHGFYDEHAASVHRTYTLPSLTIFVKAWRNSDGLDIVGVVWQPAGDDKKLSCRVLASMTAIDREVAIPVSDVNGSAKSAAR